VAEQRYQAVMAVISDGLSVSQVAEKVGVSRQTLRTWLARYEAAGLKRLVDRSHRPVSCPHQPVSHDPDVSLGSNPRAGHATS
jgi:transposase